MPCNDSGYFDPEIAGRWGLVDLIGQTPSSYGQTLSQWTAERLLTQVEQVKRVSPSTRTFVYRNLVKALPWYTSVREKLGDPAYSGWFLKYRDGINGTYSSLHALVPSALSSTMIKIKHHNTRAAMALAPIRVIVVNSHAVSIFGTIATVAHFAIFSSRNL